MREKGTEGNDLFARLAADPRLGLTAEQLESLVAEPIEFTGAARAQVSAVVDEIEHLVAERPDAAVYAPEPIL
jgi:adenylosuccinate lyase